MKNLLSNNAPAGCQRGMTLIEPGRPLSSKASVEFATDVGRLQGEALLPFDRNTYVLMASRQPLARVELQL